MTMDNFAITHLKLWKYIDVRNNYLYFIEIYRNQTDYTIAVLFIYVETHIELTINIILLWQTSRGIWLFSTVSTVWVSSGPLQIWFFLQTCLKVPIVH